MTHDPHEHLGRYELLTQLGRGGMAETWRARLVGAAGVTKPVLIKKVLPEFANDEAFVSMFISEARISATLSHGNIAQVFDFGRMDGQYFLAMELVDGQPLHRLLRRAAKTGLQQMPIPLATYIALEMCRGLHYAHTRTDEKGAPLHIVHRDISPDNVLISYEGQVKIVDFGIAKARMLRNFNTEPGVVRGKYLYFSPEQARGREVDARTDVWATGLVLYEMLCGQLPVTGTQAAVMSRMVHGEFSSPREVRKELPSALNEIVMRALSVDASIRYESANAFGDALASFLYPFAPRFSTMNLAYLVRELFKPDLLQEGRELTVPPSFLEELAAWRGTDAPPPRPQARPPTPGPAPVSKVSSPRRGAHNAPTVRTPSVAGPSKFPKWGRLGLVAGTGLLALWGTLHWLRPARELEVADVPSHSSRLAHYPEPGDAGGAVSRSAPDASTPRAAQQVALDASSPETGSEDSVESEPVPEYPAATAFRLDSRRHVLRVPLDLVAFPRLDSTVTYRLWGSSPSDGFAHPAVLEPAPRREPPVFFLLSGEAVRPEVREGVVGRRPISIEGVRAVALFTLGEPTQDDLAYQSVYLKQEDAAVEQRFTFHPEPMRVSASKGLLIRGLDARQTYTLSLNPVGEGVFLRGRAYAPMSQVACIEWSELPSTLEPVRKVDGYAEQPLQFLLPEWREVRVRGIQGLRCGFIDDAVFDNEGEAEVRISQWDPKRPKAPPVEDARVGEATRLATQGQRLARAGQFYDAFLLAEDCLSTVPEQPDCLVLSGVMQARLGRMDGALERYRTFLRRYPSHPKAATVKELLSGHGQTRPASTP
ncbi:serine/threonine protein kinase [Myxococcus sp. CA051A]|uniref:serine/threonine-protein kinase n=1 Tax=Myxococcus sp. CA051A TaxID=2741739 RepID=UPI00157A3E30|nr:serine/threonine-protein kinase [Myxococcus sp. CA051A]NTX62536.1 serine/threonine protein kinase [Myxococcus sp. CA051A]